MALNEPASALAQPTAEELKGSAVDLALLLVRRLFADRVDRELDGLARSRSAEAGRPVPAPDRREVVATGNLRTFASLAEAWVCRPNVVAGEAEASPAEVGVRAVVAGGIGTGSPAWTGVGVLAGDRLADAAAEMAALAEVDRDLVRGWLRRQAVGVDVDEWDEQFRVWWRDVEPSDEPPVGPATEHWLTEAGHGPERWVQECARAIVDAYFLEQRDDHEGWPVRTLADLPFPVESQSDLLTTESDFHWWLLQGVDSLDPAAYPHGPTLLNRVLVARRKQRYASG